MYVDQPAHETRNAPFETCVDDLAVALGMWIGSALVSEMQAGCFIYSTLKLAKASGVDRERAIQPFDVFRDLANRVWDEIEAEVPEEIVFAEVSYWCGGTFISREENATLPQIGSTKRFGDVDYCVNQINCETNDDDSFPNTACVTLIK